MDFSAWSPSHTILVIVVVVGFIGQVVVLFYRTGLLEKQIEKQGGDIRQQGETFFHAIERLEDRMDKRFAEVISQVQTDILSVRTEIADVRSEIAGVRQDMNQQIAGVREEVADVRKEISKLNQNHIDHLTYHGREGQL